MSVATCAVCGRIVERVDAHERHDVDCPNFDRLVPWDGEPTAPVYCNCPYELTCGECCPVCNPKET